MDFIYPLTRIVSECIGKTIDKFNFRRNHIAARHLVILIFATMSFSLGVYILLTGRPFPHFTPVSFGLIVAIGLISFLANVFDFGSLKLNDISLREPMLGFKPILAGLFGYMLFPAERKASYLIAFGLGATVVYFGTHRRKLRVRQKKGMFYMFMAVFFYAVLPSMYKHTLSYVSPEYITFLRASSILVLSLIFLPPKKITKPRGKVIYGLASGLVYSVGTVASLYAIQKLGVVVTMLLLLLEPGLKYLISWFILKEKVRKGEVASSIALAVIVFAAIVK